MLANLTFKAKLMLLSVLTTLLMLTISIVSFVKLESTTSNLKEISEVNLKSVAHLLTALEAQSDIRVAVTRYLTYENVIMPESEAKRLSDRITEGNKIIKENLAAYEKLPMTPEEEKLFKEFKKEWDEFAPLKQKNKRRSNRQASCYEGFASAKSDIRIYEIIRCAVYSKIQKSKGRFTKSG